MAKLSPVFNDQTIDANGDPLVGGLLFTYAAGSSTKQTVYTNAAGSVPHSNPIVLNSLGYPTQGPIWIPEGISVKFVLAPPTDTDPPTSPIKTVDNVQGVNDASVSISEWQASVVVPDYISATSFSLPGDQTTEFQKGRRAQFTTSGGTKYGKIINSVFTTMTTITMLMDGSDVLDSGLSVVNLSLLRATPSALPNPIELLRSSVVGHATLTPTWDYAYGEIQDVSGVITYAAIPAAPRAGATRIWYPAAGSIMTNGGNITVQGNQSITAAAGDKWIINAVTTTTFYVEAIKKDGLPIISADLVPKRQTVFSGSVDSSGAANFLSAGTGLSINLAATTVPVATAFSAGFNSRGQVDYVGRVTADIAAAWSGLTANSTLYLFIDRNVSTGALTYVFSTLAPTYGFGITKSTVNGQRTYRIDEGVMYVGNGSVATAVQQVCVGECVTGPSTVTSVVTYALQGLYDSGWFAIGIGTIYSKAHNVAKNLDWIEVDGWVSTLNTGANRRKINNATDYGTGITSGGDVVATDETLNARIKISSYTIHPNGVANSNSGFPGGVGQYTAGYARLFVKRGW